MNLLRNFLIIISLSAASLSNAATNEALLPELIAFVKSQGYTEGTEDYKAALKLGSLLVGTVTGAATGGTAKGRMLRVIRHWMQRRIII